MGLYLSGLIFGWAYIWNAYIWNAVSVIYGELCTGGGGLYPRGGGGGGLIFGGLGGGGGLIFGGLGGGAYIRRFTVYTCRGGQILCLMSIVISIVISGLQQLKKRNWI